MAGTTTNGFPYPESTDFVTDGAQAIEDLAVEVDARMGLYKIIPSGATNGTVAANGDVTIGSAVSTVTVDGAFSADYENYLIQISGGSATTDVDLQLRLGATTSGYIYGIVYGANYGTASGNASFVATTTGTHWRYLGFGSANGLNASIQVFSPFLAKRTTVAAPYMPHATNAAFGQTTGLLSNNTSYSSFVVDPEGAHTITGGIIRVYGYN